MATPETIFPQISVNIIFALIFGVAARTAFVYGLPFFRIGLAGRRGTEAPAGWRRFLIGGALWLAASLGLAGAAVYMVAEAIRLYASL